MGYSKAQEPELTSALLLCRMRPGDQPLQILTQNQLFPTARPDFVQQNGDRRRPVAGFKEDSLRRGVALLFIPDSGRMQ